MVDTNFGDSALAVFDGMMLSYTYENDWQFTNVFDGSTRITEVEGRGTLRERVVVRTVGEDKYMIGWIDDEMGPLTQLVDLAARELLVSIVMDGKLDIWRAKITRFEAAKS